MLDTSTGVLSFNLDFTNPDVRALALGQHIDVPPLTIPVVDSLGFTDQTTVTFTIDGSDHVVPVVQGQAADGGQSVTLDALANFGHSATLSITGVPDLPPGVTFDPATKSFTLDPSNAAYQHLAAGQQTTVTVHYGVTDGLVTEDTSVSWTVTGTNQAPVVSGVVAGSATEGNAAVTLDALANASDVDDGTILSVTGLPESLPAGVTFDPAKHTFTLDPSNAAYQHLAVGEQATVTVSYQVSDGITSTDASVSWTVTGTNEAPVVLPATTATGSITAVPLEQVGTPETALAASYLSDGHVLVNGLGGAAGFGEYVLDRGDDNSSAAIDITSVFGPQGLNFFGKDYTSIYINNNGNITFNNASSAFTPNQINAGANNPIIAPFWADVDTRGGAGRPTSGGELHRVRPGVL